MGVDCLSVISPYFVSVSQDDIYNHFSAVAKAVDMPILLYNIPARTGNNIDFKTVKKLMEFENIIGIKDSSGNFDNTLKYIENTNSRINVLAGSDSLILWTLMAGGTGAISGCSNVFPELMVSIYNYFIILSYFVMKVVTGTSSGAPYKANYFPYCNNVAFAHIIFCQMAVNG